jgi:hypothetical protein
MLGLPGITPLLPPAPMLLLLTLPLLLLLSIMEEGSLSRGV